MKRVFVAPWLAYSLVTVLLWGLWGFESKWVVDRASPYAVQVLFTIGLVFPAGVALLSPRRFAGTNRSRGFLFAAVTGLLGGIGNLTMYGALTSGKTAIVVSVTSLAPLVTVLGAAVLLKERIRPRQALGLVLALIAIVLMSI